MGLNPIFSDEVLVNQESSATWIDEGFGLDPCSVVHDDYCGELKRIVRFLQRCFSEP